MVNFHTSIAKLLRLELRLAIFGSVCLTLMLSWTSKAWSERQAYSQDALNHLKQGSQLLHDGKFSAARREFEQSLAIEKQCPEALNKIGVAYRREGMIEKAKVSFQQALAQQPDYMPSLNNLGTVMYLQEHYGEAANLYKRALSVVNGNDAEIHTNLGNVLRDKGDYSTALEHYRAAIKLQPDYAPAYNNMGLLLYRLKQYQQASLEIAKAITLKNNYSEAFYNLGLVYKAEDRIANSLKAFQDSLKCEKNPTYAKDTQRWIDELRQLNVAENHLKQGLKLLQSKDFVHAEQEFHLAIAAHGDSSAIAWNNLGLVLANQGKFRQAIKAYHQAISLSPSGFAIAQYNLGQSLHSLHDLAAAETAFRQAIQESNGRFPHAHNMLGILLKERGDLANAAKSYRLAILQSGDTLPVVHYNLALVLEKLDSSREAVSEYKLYLAQAPDGVNRKQAILRLNRLGIEVQ